jgi:hypothetical protein
MPSWPLFDAADAFPEFTTLRAAMAERDWSAVAAFFAGLTTSDGVICAASVAAEVPGSEEFLKKRATMPWPDPLAGLLFAERLIVLGWTARTSARAKHVSRQQFETFHEYLRDAERILMEITARDPGNVPAWAARLKTARGLELGQAEARRRYDQGAKRDPHCYHAQLALLQQLCPKWNGTLDRAHAFAAECALAAPDGSLNASVVAWAHIEHWMELPEAEQAGYLAQPQVRQELVDAANRSVLHPAFRRVHGWVSAHSSFAMAFSLAGNHSTAARHFEALGDLASESPWSYLPDAAGAIQRHRAAAAAAADAADAADAAADAGAAT